MIYWQLGMHTCTYTHTELPASSFTRNLGKYPSLLQNYGKKNVTPFAILFAASDSDGGGGGRGKLLAEQLKVPLHLNFD